MRRDNLMRSTQLGSGGGGKKGGSGPKIAANTLQGRQMARIVELVAGGRIRGPAVGNDWYKSTLFENTPVHAADGTVNLPGVTLEARLGDPDQAPLPGFPAVESSIAVGVEVAQATPVVRRIETPEIDAVRVSISVQALLKTDTKTGDVNGHVVKYKISVKSSADDPESEYVVKVDETLRGKNTSPYPKSYRIALDGDAPWDVKVERVSADDPDDSTQSKFAWAYYVEIIDRKLIYPNNALVGAIVNAEIFGSRVGARSFDIFGLEIPAPDNYTALDDGGGTYAGEWDGTFETKYCSNPVWVLNALLTNDRYGLGDLFTQADIDKFTLYQIAQYCDAYQARAGTLTATFTAAGGNVALAGDTYTKTGGGGAWNNQVYSDQTATDRAVAKATAVAANKAVAFGLNGSPSASADLATIDYAWELEADGTCRVNQSGTVVWDTDQTYAADDEFAVLYAEGFVRFYQNGTLRHSIPALEDMVLGFDSSFYTDGAALKDLAFNDGGWTNDYSVTGMHGVPNGKGLYEPRFSFNATITNREEAKRVLENVCGMMRVGLLWRGGWLSATQDAPTTPSRPFTPANVKDGIFSYAGTALSARHTIVHVNWINPDAGWEVDTVVIEDRESILRYGYNLLEISAFGCTSYGQAYRTGLAALLTERLETDSVTFEVGLQNLQITPGEVIQVSDPAFLNARHGGRLVSSSTTEFVMDQPFDFDAARTYRINVVCANGAVVCVDVDNPETLTDTVPLVATFEESNLPVSGAMFIIESDEITPRYFRVLQVSESSMTEAKVFGVEYNALKFGLIDSGALNNDPTDDFGRLNQGTEIAAVTNLGAYYYIRTINGVQHGVLLFRWDPSEDSMFNHYQFSVRQGSGNWQTISLETNSYEILDPQIDVISASVRAVNHRGRLSPSESNAIDLSLVSYVDTTVITDLHVVGGTNEWEGPDVHLDWTFNSPYRVEEANKGTLGDPIFKHFRVDVCTEATDTVLASYEVVPSIFTLTRDMLNAASGGQAARAYRINLYAVDHNDNASDPTVLNISNPAPALPSHTATATAEHYQLDIVQPADADFVGYLVWASDTTGFTPGPSNLVWSGAGNPVLPAVPGSTVYYRYAAYDAFGSTGLNVSTEQSIAIPGTLQYIDEDGRNTDWRGQPTNAMGGAGMSRSAISITGGGSSGINIQAVTLYVPGEGSISMPSGSFSGLSATKHWVFYDRQANDYVTETVFANAAAKMNDATGRYVYVGSRTPGGSTYDNLGAGETP